MEQILLQETSSSMALEDSLVRPFGVDTVLFMLMYSYQIWKQKFALLSLDIL